MDKHESDSPSSAMATPKESAIELERDPTAKAQGTGSITSLPTADVETFPSAPAEQHAADGAGNGDKSKGRRNGSSHDGKDKKRKSRGGGSDRQREAYGKPDRSDWRDVKRRRRDADGNILDTNGKPIESFMNIPFSAEEIADEERKPKRKVAVLIGYAGTGYKGMQIAHKEKTIEGELFNAFVKAGAVSKANANDPQKISLVRCARTDKGVHAAGNVISLNMIIEDPDIVQKINDLLPAQIRVWGLERTNNKFSCYMVCDSRWYEYLLPSYSLLPPHPDSFLGTKISEAAKEKGVYDECLKRWDDVKDFWAEVEANDIKPILDKLDPEVRKEALEILHSSEPFNEESYKEGKQEAKNDGNETAEPSEDTQPLQQDSAEGDDTADKKRREFTPGEKAAKDLKAAYASALRRYRVTPERLQQLQGALDAYVGTNNFHNYTIMKKFTDNSAKRHIKSFIVNPQPIQIRGTEWLSLKVHGQSFMMHQIRKMVAMAVLVVRCATPLSRIGESYGRRNISIPKAPGLGLLLERPVFESYNKRAKESLGKEPIDFSKYDAQIEEFKNREIYPRMWNVEEKDNIFHNFWRQIDGFRTDYFLWVTANGMDASYERKDREEKVPRALEAQLGEDEDPEGGEG